MKRAVCIAIDLRIMARGNEVRFERASPAPEPIELDFAIAHYARIRRTPADIFGDKISNHTRCKISAQIDHVKWEVHPLGHSASVLKIIVRATSAAPLSR